MKKRPLLMFFAIVAALVLAACGGESDEDKVVEAIETSATTTDPADCLALSTQNFLEQTEDESGEAAVKACEEDAEDSSDDPDSVIVTEVEVDGTSATANVEFEGGSFDRQAMAIALVEEDGAWKLDEITGFESFDKSALIEAFEEQLNEPAAELEAGQVACIVEGLEEVSAAELEEMILSDSADMVVEIAEECA